jgi:uncharacterized RDD family membrane protein YckC
MPTQDLPNAGLVKRLAAMVYDTFLVFAVLALATLIASLFLGSNQPATVDNAEVIHQLNPMLSGPIFQAYLLAVMSLFFCWFWHNNGQTLGMQAWRLQIVASDGGRPGWRQCVIRLLAATLSFACLGMGYWWIWIDRERLSWHDRLSKTRIIQLPKA